MSLRMWIVTVCVQLRGIRVLSQFEFVCEFYTHQRTAKSTLSHERDGNERIDCRQHAPNGYLFRFISEHWVHVAHARVTTSLVNGVSYSRISCVLSINQSITHSLYEWIQRCRCSFHRCVQQLALLVAPEWPFAIFFSLLRFVNSRAHSRSRHYITVSATGMKKMFENNYRQNEVKQFFYFDCFFFSSPRERLFDCLPSTGYLSRSQVGLVVVSALFVSSNNRYYSMHCFETWRRHHARSVERVSNNNYTLMCRIGCAPNSVQCRASHARCIAIIESANCSPHFTYFRNINERVLVSSPNFSGTIVKNYSTFWADVVAKIPIYQKWKALRKKEEASDGV